MLAGSHVITNIHERDSEIEVLFGGLKLRGYRAFQMLVADIEMNVGAVDQFLDWSGDHLLKVRLRLVEFVLLHGAEPGLIALQRLRVTGIIRDGLLRVRFLSHVQNSSCALGNGELLGIVLSN